MLAVIKKIPRGKVATYGQIAELAGRPGASRAVAWLLHSSSKKHSLPWQRVVNSKGMISFARESVAYTRQKRLLTQEGVQFLPPLDRIQLPQFQWKPVSKKAKKRP